MNKSGETLKKEDELWITEQVTDDIWTWIFWLFCDADFRCALLTTELPVIRF